MISVVISTINERIFKIVLPKILDSVNYIIIHQNFSNCIGIPLFLENRDDVKYYTFDQKGLSASRNFGIRLCNSEYVHFMDDDVEINIDNILSLINFMKNENIDVGTGMYKFNNGSFPTKYKSKPFFHNLLTLGKVSSIEISVRLNSLIENDISFDENFGLGTNYPSGEEYIFLSNCLRSGLMIKFYPILIGIHPNITSGMDFFSSDSKILAKKKMLEKAFGNYSFLFKFLFWLKKIYILWRAGHFIKFTKLFFFRS
jgi:glycosyltransferase involved in cell wall biosynthesis